MPNSLKMYPNSAIQVGVEEELSAEISIVATTI
jgi:hypothetical protein